MAIRRPNKNVKPAAKKTVAKKPAAKKPAAKKPAAKKTVAKKLNNAPKKISLKRRLYEYEKIAGNGNNNLFNSMGQRVQRGEMKWAYFAVEDNIGYHFYIKLK